MNPSTGNPIENILTYNTLGQKLTMADPDMGNWEYTYDLNGNLKTQKDARNTTITFDYDALNRKIKKTYPDNSFAEYQYDGAVNGIGLLWKKSNTGGSTVYVSYDEMGRILAEKRTIDGVIVTLDYTYDLPGRTASKSVTKNSVLFKFLNYEFYPGTNLLERVSDGGNNTLAVITRYSPQGKMESISFGGGKTVTNYDYVPLTGRLNTINAYTVSGGLPLICKGYDYNKSGDITALHDIKNNIDYTYAYDHLHRLISEESSGGGASAATTVEVIDFTYTQESGKPVHAPTETQLNDASTQYYYTATGTRLNKVDGFNTTAYEVNYDNQIKKITESGIVTNFFYDADGKRIKKTQGAYTTLYFGKDFEIINNVSTLYAFAGNLRIAKMTAAATEYYHKDHQGSTNAITTDTGTILDTAEYLPYGPDRSVNALLNRSAYKYTDQEQDAGTGLYNYDARLYDPVLGQFVMADTIVPDPFNPQSLNRYAYCLNNPIRYVDPTGHHTGGDNGPGLGDEGPGGYSFGSMGGCRGGEGPPGYNPKEEQYREAVEKIRVRDMPELTKQIKEIARDFLNEDKMYPNDFLNPKQFGRWKGIYSDVDPVTKAYMDDPKKTSIGIADDLPAEKVPEIIAHEIEHQINALRGHYELSEEEDEARAYDIQDKVHNALFGDESPEEAQAQRSMDSRL